MFLSEGHFEKLYNLRNWPVTSRLPDPTLVSTTLSRISSARSSPSIPENEQPSFFLAKSKAVKRELPQSSSNMVRPPSTDTILLSLNFKSGRIPKFGSWRPGTLVDNFHCVANKVDVIDIDSQPPFKRNSCWFHVLWRTYWQATTIGKGLLTFFNKNNRH